MRPDGAVSLTDGLRLCFIQMCPLLRNLSAKVLPEGRVRLPYLLHTRSKYQVTPLVGFPPYTHMKIVFRFFMDSYQLNRVHAWFK